MDGAAVTSSRIFVPARRARSHPKPLDTIERIRRDRAGRAGAFPIAKHVRRLGCKPAPPIQMEWHMKRLCQRCRVSPSSLDLAANLTLQPEPDLKWVLLWRDNQWHRPPSKR
jgi:hypothetical protein